LIANPNAYFLNIGFLVINIFWLIKFVINSPFHTPWAD
jgi:hypothetical protein